MSKDQLPSSRIVEVRFGDDAGCYLAVRKGSGHSLRQVLVIDSDYRLGDAIRDRIYSIEDKKPEDRKPRTVVSFIDSEGKFARTPSYLEVAPRERSIPIYGLIVCVRAEISEVQNAFLEKANALSMPRICLRTSEVPPALQGVMKKSGIQVFDALVHDHCDKIARFITS